MMREPEDTFRRDKESVFNCQDAFQAGCANVPAATGWANSHTLLDIGGELPPSH